MKYVLGLMFEFEYYKNPANMKVFVDNQLIDEVDLVENIKMKDIIPPTIHDNTHLYNWYRKWVDDKQWEEIEKKAGMMHLGSNMQKQQIPEKAFVYTLDETMVQGSVKVEITNDNTNYSNGFMTKWSSFKFHDVFLMPTYYLNVENYVAFFEKLKQIRDNIPNYPSTAEEMYSLQWPNEFRVVKDGKFMPGTPYWRKWEVGGSWIFELPIMEYVHEKGLKILGPTNYEQLIEKEKRRLITDSKMPLFLSRLKLINTQNETA